MPARDAPDYQTIITLQTGGTLTDAPDWTNVVTGPGGTQPVVGTGGNGLLGMWGNAGFLGVTIDPGIGPGTQGLLSPNLTVMAFVALFTGPVHNVIVPLTGGNTLTSNSTFAGVYDMGQASAGNMTLLCTSASGAAATAWTNQGSVPVAMTTNPTLTAGQSYAIGLQVVGGGLACFGPDPQGSYTSPNFSTFPVQGVIGNNATSLLNPIPFSSLLHAGRYFMAMVD
jgi:hypothetical protein